MEYGRRPLGEGTPSPRLPWWMGRRVRLSALLLALVLTVLALTGTRSHLFPGATASARNRCTRPVLPEVVSVDLAQLTALRASLLPVVTSVGGHRSPGGTVTPVGVRSGIAPQNLGLSRSTGGLWPAGYQLREHARSGDSVVADVLLFASPRQALRYVELTARADCRRPAITSDAPSPPEALNLVSLDFFAFTTYEALLARGPRVYRIAEVHPQRPPGGPSNREARAGLSRVDALACRLADAQCRASG
jgi:hypothetical protein